MTYFFTGHHLKTLPGSKIDCATYQFHRAGRACQPRFFFLPSCELALGLPHSSFFSILSKRGSHEKNLQSGCGAGIFDEHLGF